MKHWTSGKTARRIGHIKDMVVQTSLREEKMRSTGKNE
jgi:hypothetical protein